MRYGSTLAILVFALALVAGVVAFVRGSLALRRTAEQLDRTGMPARAELLRMQLRTALFGGGGTLVFVTALWLAIFRDLRSCS